MRDNESNPAINEDSIPSLQKDWSNAPTVTALKNDLQMAESSHQAAVVKVNKFLDNLNITGSAKKKFKKGRSRVQPKLIRKHAEWRYSALSEPFLSTEDLYNIYPTTFEDKLSAEQNQLVLNNQFNTKLDKVAFIDEYVRTAVDEGTVIVRVGWDFKEAEVEVEDIEYEYFAVDNQADLMMLQTTIQLQQQDPSRYQAYIPPAMKESVDYSLKNGGAYLAVEVSREMVTRTTTIKNQPTVEVCDFNNVIPDPLCKGNLDNAEFVIYTFETSLDELEKRGNYENLDLIQVENASPLSEPDHYHTGDDTSANFQDKPRQKFVAYEYWGNWDIDGTGETKPIVATWVGNTMIRLEENPYPDKKHPFISVQYLPVRKSINGEPDGVLLEENQEIIGATTRGMVDIMARSANGQTGIRKDALDVTNRRKFDSGEDYEINPTVDARQAFYMHQYPEISSSAPLMLQLQNADAESLTGVTGFSSGLSGKSLGDTATGVRGVLDAATKRELGILRRLASGIIKIGHKVIALNAAFLEEEEVVRVTNEKFVLVRRDDLAGKIDLRLSISTAEADNQKAEELSFMLQTVGNSMGPDLTKIILADIAKLRKMPDLARRVEEWEPRPDPEAVKNQQLENLLLEAKIQEVYANAQNSMSGANLDRAKAITEEAKALNLQADTDQKHLDFVEQESGVAQERELEKQSVQAKANMGLKVMEHSLKSVGSKDQQ